MFDIDNAHKPTMNKSDFFKSVGNKKFSNTVVKMESKRTVSDDDDLGDAY